MLNKFLLSRTKVKYPGFSEEGALASSPTDAGPIESLGAPLSPESDSQGPETEEKLPVLH